MLIWHYSSPSSPLFPAYFLSSLLVDILLEYFFLSSSLSFFLTEEREQESTTKTSLVFSSSSNIIRDKTEGNLPSYSLKCAYLQYPEKVLLVNQNTSRKKTSLDPNRFKRKKENQVSKNDEAT